MHVACKLIDGQLRWKIQRILLAFHLSMPQNNKHKTRCARCQLKGADVFPELSLFLFCGIFLQFGFIQQIFFLISLWFALFSLWQCSARSYKRQSYNYRVIALKWLQVHLRVMINPRCLQIFQVIFFTFLLDYLIFIPLLKHNINSQDI